MSTWANKTKQALSTVDMSNLKPVGGSGEAYTTFYQFRPLGEKASPKAAQLTKGTQIVGEYVKKNERTRQITLKNGNKKSIKETTFVIKTDAGTVSVPSCGQLTNARGNGLMDRVPYGATVSITYNGMEAIAKGEYAGTDAHSFLVAASEQKA